MNADDVLERLDRLAETGRPLDFDDWHKLYRPILTGSPTMLDVLGIGRGDAVEDATWD